ncbi:MAG: DUF4143 domain-containing protein [Mariprofundaceae bacterium]|nr:DUF4143 domain-containing protein [Mariprofundaceae bacterium]
MQRDIPDLAKLNPLEVLPEILKLSAAQSGQLLNMSDIAAPFKITRQTIKSYLSLLQRVFLVDTLPAWYAIDIKRLVTTPKVHLTDTGLAAQLLAMNGSKLEADRKVLAPLLESFVYNELRRQASWVDEDVQFYHFRDKDQYEVDIVIEHGGGDLIGVDVKAAASVNSKDFKGLRRLQTISGSNFQLGLVFYDGDKVLSFGEQLFAVPISQLWQAHAIKIHKDSSEARG